MTKIKKEYKEAYSFQFEQELKDLWGYEKFDKFTKDKIIEHLFGNGDHYSHSKFKVVHRRNPYIETTPLQRINRLWVFPLYFIFVAPYNYIVKGDSWTDSESKFGKFLSKLIGNI